MGEPNGKKFWNPKVMYIVVQKHILDRFGELQKDGSLRPPRQAAVLYDYVMSQRLWDFIAWYNIRGKNRPLRYIVIKDDLKLAQRGGAVDLFQFCYSLCFTYCYSVPFPLGNPNQPSPVKYAKHFAEIIAQQILTTDTSFDSFRTTSNLNRPHLCKTHSDAATLQGATSRAGSTRGTPRGTPRLKAVPAPGSNASTANGSHPVKMGGEHRRQAQARQHYNQFPNGRTSYSQHQGHQQMKNLPGGGKQGQGGRSARGRDCGGTKKNGPSGYYHNSGQDTREQPRTYNH